MKKQHNAELVDHYTASFPSSAKESDFTWEELPPELDNPEKEAEARIAALTQLTTKTSTVCNKELYQNLTFGFGDEPAFGMVQGTMSVILNSWQKFFVKRFSSITKIQRSFHLERREPPEQNTIDYIFKEDLLQFLREGGVDVQAVEQ